MELSTTLCSVLITVTLLFETVNSALFYPTNSAYGVFAAIAVPLDLPNRNVFISYNFEANYNLPINYEVPEHLEGIVNDNFYEEETRKLSNTKCSNCTSSQSSSSEEAKESNEQEKEEEPAKKSHEQSSSSEEAKESNEQEKEEEPAKESHERKRRSLFTREHFYYILKDKFKRAGYNDHTCLLRLICETNASMLGDNNGVLGSLVHILFSPSTSEFENLPIEYYQAEFDGINNDCVVYVDECKENLLDLISQPLHAIVNQMMFNK